MTARPRLLILGASTRAAAWSARRAGYQPVCVDSFLDADLRSIAEVHPLATYPDGFVSAVADLPPTPWIYTGGLENYPDLIAEISAIHPLYGNGPEQLRFVRDPLWLDRFYERHSIPHLRVAPSHAPPPADGTWLLKPLKSSGGSKIIRWNRSATDSPVLQSQHYFQEYRTGKPCSALYLASSNQTDLIATFEQLVGHPERGDLPPFLYRGSLFPAFLPQTFMANLARIGSTLAADASLQGLFGIDFIWSGETFGSEESLWPVEINPRYTSSLELFEFATGRPLLVDHCTCFSESQATTSIDGSSSGLPHPIFAKQILYAPVPLRIDSPLIPLPDLGSPRRFPPLADIPPRGTEIPRGEPVCTLYTNAPDRATALQNLAAAESSLLRRLGLPDPPVED